jgi:hemoglobin
MRSEREITESVRERLIAAATAAYEDAGVRGLCGEGRWEAAIAALRGLDLGRGALDPSPTASIEAHASADASAAAGPATIASSSPAATQRDLADEDLHELMVRFYGALVRDPLVGRYFAELDLSAHIPRIVAFWSTALFRTRRYSGNAFLPHQRLEGLTSAHFARWIQIFEREVGEAFEGPNAKRILSNAHRIAYSMQIRLGIAPFAEYRPGTRERAPP